MYLLSYIVFNDEPVKNINAKEPIVKTVIEEKIVYLKKDRQSFDEKKEVKKESNRSAPKFSI